MGIPLTSEHKLHDQMSAMQIGKYWRTNIPVVKEKIMSLYAILNVMDHFIYFEPQSSNRTCTWNFI